MKIVEKQGEDFSENEIVPNDIGYERIDRAKTERKKGNHSHRHYQETS